MTKLRNLIIAAIVIIGFWWGSMKYIYWRFPDTLDNQNHIIDNSSIRGTYGDMFGAVNSLFSGLALAGLIYTVILQRQQMKDQDAASKEAKKELEDQKEILNDQLIHQKQQNIITEKVAKDQLEQIQIQRFESTFFHMITLHHQLVNSIENTKIIEEKSGWKYDSPSQFVPITTHGRAVLKEITDNYKLINLNNEEPPSLETLLDRFTKLYNDNDHILGHYFRNLYHIVRLIHDSDDLTIKSKESNEPDPKSTFEARMKYIRIIRAQLSSRELVLLLYNSLTKNGEGFHRLIKTYKLLHNIPDGLLPNVLQAIFVDLNQN